MANTQTTTTGISFGGVLTILFIGLKLAGHITWSWWWVFSPLWLPVAIIVSIFAIVLIVGIILHLKG